MCEPDLVTDKFVNEAVSAAKKHYATIERVRNLHRPGSNEAEYDCNGCFQEYPCDTIRALDGEE